MKKYVQQKKWINNVSFLVICIGFIYIHKKTVKVLHIKSYLQYKSCKEVNKHANLKFGMYKSKFFIPPLSLNKLHYMYLIRSQRKSVFSRCCWIKNCLNEFISHNSPTPPTINKFPKQIRKMKYSMYSQNKPIFIYHRTKSTFFVILSHISSTIIYINRRKLTGSWVFVELVYI